MREVKGMVRRGGHRKGEEGRARPPCRRAARRTPAAPRMRRARAQSRTARAAPVAERQQFRADGQKEPEGLQKDSR